MLSHFQVYSCFLVFFFLGEQKGLEPPKNNYTPQGKSTPCLFAKRAREREGGTTSKILQVEEKEYLSLTRMSVG